MAQPPSPENRLWRWMLPGRQPPLIALGQAALMFGVLLGATELLQWRAGAYTGTLTGDAAAHYVTGLMVHDWLHDHLGSDPVLYLINYHAHLPLTALGLWPPIYYGVEAGWMLLAGTGKPAMIALSGRVTALLGLTVGLAVARRTGWAGGLLIGLFLVASPLVQRASNELMLDVADALCCLLAAMAYAAYLARQQRTAIAGFGLLAATAMLVKYNALALAYLPPLCVVIGRRWDLLRRPGFYAPAVIVCLLAGPWYLATHGLAEQGFQFSWGPAYLRAASIYNAVSIAEALTPLMTALALVGLGRVLCHGYGLAKAGPTPIEIACAALSLSMFLFLLTIPIALQDRYLIPCLAPMLVLAAHEAQRLFDRLKRPAQRGALIGMLVISVAVFASPAQPVAHDRLQDAAKTTLATLPESNPVVLLVADGTTEPAMIAAIAMAEPRRPAAWVIRGSRLFGAGGYNNADYKPRFADPQALLTELDRYGIARVLFQPGQAKHRWTHVHQFAALVAAAPDRFQTVAIIPGAAPIHILRVIGNEQRQPDPAALTLLSGPQALLKQ